MDIRKVKKLIELLENSNVAEIEITEDKESIRIVRGGSGGVPILENRSETAVPKIPEPTSVDEKKPSGHAITSPMVGTFYSAPAPDAKPFVAVGQKIDAGDVVCIIEAMKIMNQIEADRAGTVVEILAGDGDAVEFGQNLIILQ